MARSDRRWFIGLCVVSLVMGLALAVVLGWFSPRLLVDPVLPPSSEARTGEPAPARQEPIAAAE